MCIRSSLHSVHFWQLLRYAHKRIVNIIKVYIERNNMQVVKIVKKSSLFTFTFAKISLILRHGSESGVCLLILINAT